MNKNIIALAVAASVAMPVIASADMQIIGQAQLELVNTSTGGAGNPVNEGLSLDDGSAAGNVGSGNASALGIAGSQELGNGLTGVYKINLNFQADDGAGGGLSRSRDMYLGLKGDFGTVMAGRMNSPYKSSTALWDPLYATFMQARGSNGMSVLHNGYINNSIGYTNKFGEANIAAAIALGELMEVDKVNIKRAIENYHPKMNRSEWRKTKQNEVLLDAYNANPDSMHAVIKTFAQLQKPNKWYVLGDMFELGEYALQEHQEVVNTLKICDAKNVVLVGINFKNTISQDTL